MESRNKPNTCKRAINKSEVSKTKIYYNNGITLIALVVTIVVLLILASITLNYTIGDNGMIKEAQKSKNEVIDKTANAEQESQSLITEIAGEERIDGVTKLIADGSWNIDKQVNTPKLLSGMTGIYWDESGNEVTVTAENYDNWYNYAAQTGTTDGTSRWANAKTEDGSYWVWIPRFAYKIESGRYTSTAGTISIKFLQGTSNKDANGNIISTTYPSTTGETMESYVVHPSFRDGSSSNFMNGEWDEELTGFWVAKYEMSMETNGVHTETSSSTEGDANNGNILISSTIKVVSKPGVSSWRCITIGNMYTNSYNYNRSYESHLMKNSEWGAVAYLTQSSYGRNGNEVWINNSSSYITGSCGNSVSAEKDVGTTTDYKSTQGLNASTTGNVTGIYDMSGGAWERVAAYIANGNDILKNSASSFVTVYDKNAEGYKTLCTKYVTVYPYNSLSDGNNDNWITYNNAKTSSAISGIKYGYGDSILETSNAGIGVASWNNDYSYFLKMDTPFLARGGVYIDASSSGMFAFDHSSGNPYYSNSFRVVLAVS